MTEILPISRMRRSENLGWGIITFYENSPLMNFEFVKADDIVY